MRRTILAALALFAISPALAQQAPPAPPAPQRAAPDPADQLARCVAQARALFTKLQIAEGEGFDAVGEKASLEAKLNAAIARGQALDAQIASLTKEIADTAKGATPAPAAVPEARGKP